MTRGRAARLRPSHCFSARTRLAFSYALMVIICGAVLLTVLVLYLVYGPDYAFDSVPANSDGDPLIIVPNDPEVIDDSFSVKVQSREDFITLLITASAVVLVALAALSSIVAWWLAGRMLRPLAHINKAARIAASGRLDHRIGLSGPRDEIIDLAQTFDMMLDSIERFNAAQRRFAANASHELRTPLATNKTIIDVALAKPGAIDREVLERLAQLNERSIRTVESLLDLAEAETGEHETTTVNLAEVVCEALDQCESDAREQHLTVERSLTPALALGDERLFIQLVQNLIQNAIRHNIDGGHVIVCTKTVHTVEGSVLARLTVENTGQVIDPDVVDGLTEPFRTVQGRTAGNSRGLGLAIVAAIVHRSQGTLDIAARQDGGLVVNVTLPGLEHSPAVERPVQGADRSQRDRGTVDVDP